jgi:hypothetical protein
MTQWGSFVCAIFPVVLKGGVDRPVSVQRTSTGRTWNRRLHTHRAKGVRFVSLKPGSLKRRSRTVRGLTGDHGKTDGYDVPDAYDATTPILQRSTAAVSQCRKRHDRFHGARWLQVEPLKGGAGASQQPTLILKSRRTRSTGTTHDVRSRP